MRQRYAAIDQFEDEDLPVALLCETLGVSRSAYYAWRRHALSQRERDDHRLMPKVRDIFWEHKRRYGARRILEELAARQEPYENDGLARKEVAAYVRYYNTRRRHSALDYLTPEEFEAGSRGPRAKTCGAQNQRTKRTTKS